MDRGWEFNYKLQAMQVTEHEGSLPAEHSFAGTEGGHVVLTALKKSEDSNALIARFYEWAGQSGEVTLRTPDGVKSAEVVNLMEEPTGQTLNVHGNQVSVPVQPYMIQTVRLSF
ncbi:MAG: hypothetical protein INR71_13195 [Terriglobus roseus]|nr:hypothetical protein [Terriglobus roseus]